MKKFTERYYQREARAAVKEGLTKHKSGVLHLGTGAGKTAIVAKDIEGIKERCLFLGDQEELLDQPLRAFEEIGGVAAAREQAKIHAPLEARVVVASSQTMIKKARMERFPRNHFDRIYVDEAHRGSDRDKKICDYFETAKRIGLTATPFRATMKDLHKYYETVLYSKPMLDLCAEGFAPPMVMFHLPHEVDLSTCGIAKKFGTSDYLAEDIDSTITPELEAIAALFAEHAQHRHTIAYLPLIKTSEAFAAALRNVGVNAEHIEGGSPNRIQLQQAFKDGKIDCLTNAGVMSTGVDLPIADCYLNLRPLKSMTEYQQSAGRSMRVLPGLIDHLPEKDEADERREYIEWSQKPNTLMFDLLWQNDTLGVMTPAHLVATSEAEADEMNALAKKNLSPEDLIALKLRVQAEREARLTRALEKAAMKAANRHGVSAEHVGALIGSRALQGYEPIAEWEWQTDPVSPNQASALVNLGVNLSTVENKGHASKILDELCWRAKNKLCALWQITRIMRINEKRDPEARILAPHMLTYANAQAIIRGESMHQHAQRLHL